MSNIVKILAKKFGKRIITKPKLMTSYLEDWRGLIQVEDGVLALAVIFPKNTNEVSKILRLAYKHKIQIIPQGGNSSQTAAAVPLIRKKNKNLPIIINLSKMNKIINIDIDNRTLCVEAGAVLADVQRAVADKKMLFPIDLGAKEHAQIGGLLSTNAGGLSVLRYGNTRELSLGIEVVLPNGKVLSMLRALRKNNTGYDLKHLFIGAEGSLGIITKAVMRLYPLSKSSKTIWLTCDSFKYCREIFKRVNSKFSQEITAFEAMHIDVINTLKSAEKPMKLPISAGQWQILIQIDSQNDICDKTINEELSSWEKNKIITSFSLAKDFKQSRYFWQCREDLPNTAKEFYSFKNGYTIVRHDISLPLSQIEKFISKTTKKIHYKFPSAVILIFGHLGDGNLHFNIALDEKVKQNYQKINNLVYDSVINSFGTFSAEHGIGQVKTAQMRKYMSADEIALMELIKKNIDIKGIMNSGKVLDKK